ncbi:hypothetical protein L0P75_15880, partial [Faecalibacillus intestinalis]|uniref:hypothetical protein n=1 Tax=Faecalibacillus intestinalis TaxID=1982626 RepID=UPI001EDF790D
GGLGLPIPSDIRSLAGTVESVATDSLIINPYAIGPTSPTDTSSKVTVMVDSNTVIERLKQKDATVIQKENVAFVEAMKNHDLKTPPIP